MTDQDIIHTLSRIAVNLEEARQLSQHLTKLYTQQTNERLSRQREYARMQSELETYKKAIEDHIKKPHTH